MLQVRLGGLDEVPFVLGEGGERLVLVLGWPKNLAQLVRQLAKHGFAISILSPERMDDASEAKIEAVALMACVTSHMRRDFLEDTRVARVVAVLLRKHV